MKVDSTGTIFAGGWTNAFGQGDTDMWLVRLDSSGGGKLERAIGSGGKDSLNAIILEGASIVVAGTEAGSGLNSAYRGAYLAKLDKSFSFVGGWQHTTAASPGASFDNEFFDVVAASGGGYLTVGEEADTTGYTPLWRAVWNANGSYAGASVTFTNPSGTATEGRRIALLPGGGHVVVGSSATTACSPASGDRYWLVAYASDAGNTVLWEKTLQTVNSTCYTDLPGLVVLDGTVWLAGARKNNGDGNIDGWLVGLDAATGSVGATYRYGSSDARAQGFHAAVATSDHKLLVVGYHTVSAGDTDALVVKVDPTDGAVIAQRVIGAPSAGDVAWDVAESPLGGYVVVGEYANTGTSRQAFAAKLDPTTLGPCGTATTLQPAQVAGDPGSLTPTACGPANDTASTTYASVSGDSGAQAVCP